MRRDRLSAIRVKVEQLGLDKESAMSILMNALGIRKICVKMLAPAVDYVQKSKRLPRRAEVAGGQHETP